MEPFYKPQQGSRTKEHMHAQAHAQVNKSSSALWALCFHITVRKAIIGVQSGEQNHSMQEIFDLSEKDDVKEQIRVWSRSALKKHNAVCVFLQNPVDWQILSGTVSTLHICIILKNHQPLGLQ